MTDPLYWQLRYPFREDVTEPLANASIRLAPPGATNLVILRHLGEGRMTPLVRVELESGMRPVFYRRRGIVLDGSATTPLYGTVFGWARESVAGYVVDHKLWAAYGGQVLDCPPAWVDQKALELQFERCG